MGCGGVGAGFWVLGFGLCVVFCVLCVVGCAVFFQTRLKKGTQTDAHTNEKHTEMGPKRSQNACAFAHARAEEVFQREDFTNM